MDIEKQTLIRSGINGPPKTEYYKGIIIQDVGTNPLNELLLTGFCRNVKKSMILSMDVMNLILNYYPISQDSLHLIGDKDSHYKINVNKIFSMKYKRNRRSKKRNQV